MIIIKVELLDEENGRLRSQYDEVVTERNSALKERKVTYRAISASLTLSFFLSDILKHIYLRQHFQIICKHVLGFVALTTNC